MRGATTAQRIAHPALLESRARSLPLAEAALGDHARVGVLLQGAALLSHLRQGGWHLGDGWRGAGVLTDGTLRVAGAAPGRSRGLPQESLRELLALLFPDASTGRGDARRAARSLLAQWQQSLSPISADDLVAQILDAAPFLWRAASAAARRALGGQHEHSSGNRLWIAGPASLREQLQSSALELEPLWNLLASPDCERLFREPTPIRAGGATVGWMATVARARHQAPTDVESKVGLAGALAGLGHYRQALATLEGLPASGIAVRLKARCQFELGELVAAREGLRALARFDLEPEALAAAAELALEILTGTDPQQQRPWLERALQVPAGPALWRAHLLAAAHEVGASAAATERHLEAAQALAAIPEHAWRLHRLMAQRAAASGDGAAALEKLVLALRESRRCLTRAEAAGLWSQTARARVVAEMLPAAERAFRHAARLYGSCDGERRRRGALVRLAELRLRRGDMLGVPEILATSQAAHAQAGDHRGAAFDAVLKARLELVKGQPHVALAASREALADLDRRGLDHGRGELHVLAARALGWLGATDEAAAEIANLKPEALVTLDREERPAVFALAGEREAALLEAAGTSFGHLWRAALTGHAAPEAAWIELRALDRYRAARLVFDLELASPGMTPVYWLRRAAAALQRVGAEPLAVRLEPRKRGGWEALEAYLRSPGDTAALPQMFFASGYPEARLVWSRGHHETVLVAGSGGAEELAAAAGGGTLTLQAPLVDPTLRALFALALRDLDLSAPRPTATQVPRGGLLGESPKLHAALERVALLAPGELPMLILGETGTGKELLARQVHALSRRAAGAFLPLNCAAVSEHLLLSELFGHVRGAFTGAERDRAGVFETARGGTVFLDEIGDLPPNAQGMLLRALQEGEVRRVGESLPRKIDVRVVAATHRDLPVMVKAGAFRQDLFYRLRGATVSLPPLRERGDDIVLLAEHFLARNHRSARLSGPSRAVLLQHPWPGNVRELRNAVEVAAAIAGGRTIQPEHLDLPSASASSPGAGRATATYHHRVDTLRRELILEALAATGGRRAEAARRLGMTRQALAYLLKQLDI